MHHMFLAHVKIAFLIHMQVVHDIDMRNDDVQDPTMRNNCFFVNFEATHIPEQLTWEDGPRQMPQKTKTWLQKQQMLHTRVLIKTYQANKAAERAGAGEDAVEAAEKAPEACAASLQVAAESATSMALGGAGRGGRGRGRAKRGGSKEEAGGERRTRRGGGGGGDVMKECSDGDEEDEAGDEETEKRPIDPRVQWIAAPIMHASTERAGMKEWNARVTSAQLPRFPFEKEVCVPVKCVSIQRVNMQELCVLVEDAAREALNNFAAAIASQLRKTHVTYEHKKLEVTIMRRQFPDRFFLTRKEQHDKNAWWNTTHYPLRQRQTVQAADQLEFNWGYEDPIVERRFEPNLTDINLADHMHALQWDQVDVRMYYFNKAMQARPQWRQLANGMWYLQDYNDFFSMLKRLGFTQSVNQDHAITELTAFLPPAVITHARLVAQAREKHKLENLALSHYTYTDYPVAGVHATPDQSCWFWHCRAYSGRPQPQCIGERRGGVLISMLYGCLECCHITLAAWRLRRCLRRRRRRWLRHFCQSSRPHSSRTPFCRVWASRSTAAITVLDGISVAMNRVSFVISVKVTRRSIFVSQGCRAMSFCMLHMVMLLRE